MELGRNIIFISALLITFSMCACSSSSQPDTISEQKSIDFEESYVQENIPFDSNDTGSVIFESTEEGISTNEPEKMKETEQSATAHVNSDVPIESAEESVQEANLFKYERADEEASKPAATVAEAATTMAEEENITQKNSIAMLNHLMVITEKIKQSSNSKLYLEEVGNAMLNDFYPNAIDDRTQTQISDLYRLVNSMRMIDVKRERLAYIYDQNKAQAIMSAVPSPMSLLNVVQSESRLKAIASVLYFAIDSAQSYEGATYANEMQYLQDGWNLDDEMDSKLSALNLDAFNYGQDIVNQYGIDGDLTISQNMAKTLVEWDNNENVSRRIEFLKNHEEEYKACGYYWLLLSKSCFENGDSKGCVEAMDSYIDVQPRLLRRDADVAKALPLVIASLPDVYREDKLIEKEIFYVDMLSKNVAINDWATRYYSALTYMDLYAKTQNLEYLQDAFEAAKANVNEVYSTINNSNLIDYQLSNNETYLADITKAEASKTATRDEEKEMKQYNKMLKEVRKTELAPVDNALLMNVKLMIDLAHELNLPEPELRTLDSIIHNDGARLFLVDSIDANLWADKTTEVDSPDVTFDGDKITIPANFVCDESKVVLTVNGQAIDASQEWTVDSVKRKGDGVEDFIVTYVNEAADKIDFTDGDIVTVRIQPYEDYFDAIEVKFRVAVSKKWIITSTEFERIDQ